jgi:hypothetical protein
MLPESAPDTLGPSQWKISKKPPPPPQSVSGLEDDPILFKSPGSRVISKHHQRAAEVCDLNSKKSSSSSSNTLKLINSRILRGSSAPGVEKQQPSHHRQAIDLDKIKKVHGRILSPVLAKKNYYLEESKTHVDISQKHAAAIKIQSLFRGWFLRVYECDISLMRMAAFMIQRCWMVYKFSQPPSSNSLSSAILINEECYEVTPATIRDQPPPAASLDLDIWRNWLNEIENSSGKE